jgi:hypothetical protein
MLDASTGEAMNVIDLGQVRSLDADWKKVGEAIRHAEVTGFYLTLMGPSGKESMYIGGAYKRDPIKATSAALRMSAARMLREDIPPEFTNSHL